MSIARSNSLGQLTTSVSNIGQLAGMRNRIINGDMRIDQRNNGAAIIPPVGGYVADRFVLGGTIDNALTIQQVQDAPVGFKYSTKISVAVTTTLTAGAASSFRQVIEGSNMTDFAFGTASAKSINLSFYVKGSVAGNYSVNLVNGTTQNRSYCVVFPVTASWARVSLVIPGDTTGVWATDNTGGINLRFDLGVGSKYVSTASGVWQADNSQAVSGSIALVSQAVGASLNITGLQLELGLVATPFEQRPIGLELSLCQRYCYVQASIAGSRLNLGAGGVSSSTGGIITGSFPVAMRSIPTQVFVGANQFRILGLNNGYPVTVSAVDANLTSYSIGFTGTALTAGSGVVIQTVDSPSPSPSVTFLAEL